MKKLILFTSIVYIAFAFMSCKTTAVIPADASSTQLIQMGQDALELNNYPAAELYYKAVVMRYGMDTRIYIEARYELGHMYVKQRKYEQAYPIFMEILDIYKNAEYGSVPAAYKKLAQIELEKIPAKYKNAE